jgi:hypothetical protein
VAGFAQMFRIACSAGALVIITPSAAFPEKGGVALVVRTVHASGHAADTEKSISPQVDSRIEDLRPKLSKLRYRSFKMQAEDRDVIPLRKRRTFHLSCGHTLTVRPLYMEKERIGLWMQWLDKAGMKMLDTRMHMNTGETMVTGTEAEGDCGTILAIDVKPAE